jgi:hypothetical protein
MSMPTEAELTGIEHDRLRVEIALTDLNELPLDDLLSFLIHPARAVDEVTRLRAEVQRLTASMAEETTRADLNFRSYERSKTYFSASATENKRLASEVQRLTAERDAERERCAGMLEAKIARLLELQVPRRNVQWGADLAAKIRSGE